MDGVKFEVYLAVFDQRISSMYPLRFVNAPEENQIPKFLVADLLIIAVVETFVASMSLVPLI